VGDGASVATGAPYPRRYLRALAGAVALALLVIVFAPPAVDGIVAALAGCAATVALVRRAGPRNDGMRPIFGLLAIAWAVQSIIVVVSVVLGSRAGGEGTAAGLAHLVGAPFILGALLVVPVARRTGVRRQAVLDTVVAGLAFVLLVWQTLWVATRADGAALGWVSLTRMVVAVLIATAVVWLLSATRYETSMATPVVWSIAAAAILGVLADVVAEMQSFRSVSSGWAAALAILSAFACLLAAHQDTANRADTPRLQKLRRQVAILSPAQPLVAVALSMAVLSIQGTELPPSLVALSVGLLVALLVSTVLVRLDALDVSHHFEEKVAQRTLDLGSREQWFRALVHNSSDVISVVDRDAIVRFQTGSMQRVLGHDPALIVGSSLAGLLRPQDDQRLRAALREAAGAPGRMSVLTFPVWHREGHWCHTETTITSLLDDPAINGFVLNMRDVSERQVLEDELTKQAFSDSLTGLANRSLFREKVEGALVGETAAAPSAAGSVAVVFLDLNGFKAVNDSQGHAVGDTLLELVGQRLRNCVRPGDIVARLGGDEFAVLVTGDQAEAGAVWVSDRIRRVLAGDFVLDHTSVTVSASMGIAVNDTGDETADQLLRNADLAMYRAKAAQRAEFLRFEVSMHDDLVARVDAENDLRRAVEKGDLRLFYQPLVDLRTGVVVGAEALARWLHPERGLVSPDEFIELAEQMGLVEGIGSWAIAEAARKAAGWQHLAPAGSSFKVAVNVSGRQVNASLPRLVRDVLTETGLAPGALTLEMTESVLMDRPEQASVILKRLKSLGVRIAVDDFGTGYSSLSYLTRFPVDILKIDRSFIDHVAQESEQTELVRTIIQLGAALNLVTVAEGIEREDQRAVVTAMGCTLGQGFLFARALPAEEFLEFVTQGMLQRSLA